MKQVLIANRGEIALRIARACADLGLGWRSVRAADERTETMPDVLGVPLALTGSGPAAWLDAAALVAAAVEGGCDALHPGYGFLSEAPELAEACRGAGIAFVGPRPELLALFGDKARARAHAAGRGVPVLAGGAAADAAEAVAIADALPPGIPLLVKAAAGGGGRGIRIVEDRALLPAAAAEAQAEAAAAFGSGALVVERFVARARHLEVQVAGDAGGAVQILGDRDCSLQRRHQKLVELAPAPDLPDAVRQRLHDHARQLFAGLGYAGLATAEFLLDCDLPADDPAALVFIEVNPRLQVEHTVTEAVSGLDLVQVGLGIAAGHMLDALLPQPLPAPQGCAIQLRINAESIGADGQVRPATGTVTAHQPPGGPGVRVDTACRPGSRPDPRFDPLLAKLVVSAPDHGAMLRRAARAAAEYRIDGVATSLPLARALLADADVAGWTVDTRWLERALPRLTAAMPATTGDTPRPDTEGDSVTAPLAGLLVAIEVSQGDRVAKGRTLAVIEALKMQHVIVAPWSGVIGAILAQPGTVLAEGEPVLALQPAEVDGEGGPADGAPDPDWIRPDLAEVIARHALTLDSERPEAVARRRKTGQRTARENIADLFDPGSFIEYGALAIAAQRRRRGVDDLMRATPADGMITGIGTVNAAQFGEEAAACAALAYDYTVLAGTQGYVNHRKTDRLLDVAERMRLPIVFYAEGGGGRPGDVDAPGVSGLDTPSFQRFAALSGVAPRIGIASGRCFAGNAVLFGSCDITIATRGANIGMSGPAMIEGGGLGTFRPEDIGPVEVQVPNGVIDLLAEDEAEATALARALLALFQGRADYPQAPDQRLLRHVVPENRLRVYAVREAIAGLFDTASFIELRGGHASGMITGLARLDGRAVGVMANDPRFLGGAIDAEGASKAARFMQLCDAFALPIVSLCDTPGFMVGPDAERTAAVRHGARMFVVAAGLHVPFFTVILRKAYGLGAQAMAGGSLPASHFTVSWPTGELGGMGLEGAVRLGYRKELEAIADPVARDSRYRELVQAMYDRGKAVSVAQHIEVDAVIDPAATRDWLIRGLAGAARIKRAESRRFIDCW